jgi:flagellar hook-associated protein 3 FlgL
VASQTSDFSSTASFQQQLQAQLTALTAALNTTYGSAYVFSGTNTSTPPIKSPLPDPAVIGVAGTTYYQGSEQNVTFRVGDNETITQGIRADDPAFQQIYAGIQQALSITQASGTGTGNQNDALTSAQNLIDQGLQGVIGLQATVNANIVNIQQVNTNSQTTQTYLQGLISNIDSADVVSLSTQVAWK